MAHEHGPAPHQARISAADRADGSVEVLGPGGSRVFTPAPGRGADDARLRALRHLRDTAAALGRPVRVTTWTLDRSRASLVVTPSGECYDEARPHSSFVIPDGRATTSGATPAADIPAATRPWGLALPPAAPIRGRRTTPRGPRRTQLVVAAALALLLLWSGVVAVLLTTGHGDSAAAGGDRTDPPTTAADSAVTSPTPTSTTSTTSTTAAAAVRPTPTGAVTASPPAPLVDARSAQPGRLRLRLARLGASRVSPLTVRLRVDPATGPVVRRTTLVRAGRRTWTLTGLAPGPSTWVVLVPGRPLVVGHTVVAASPPPPPPPTPTAPPTPTPTPAAPTSPPTPGPGSGGHGHGHGGGGHGGGGGGGGGGEPHPTSSPPPPHPVDPTLPRPSATSDAATGDAPATGRAARDHPVDRPALGYRIPGSGHADGGWIGSRTVETGVRVYRVDPLASDRPTGYGRAHPVRRLERAGRVVPARAAARAAWLLSSFGRYPDPTQAAAVDAATYHLLVGRGWRWQGSRGAVRIAQSDRPDYLRSFVRQMLRGSARLAGPYSTTVTTTPALVGDPSHVRLRLRSATGDPVAGRRVRFALGGVVKSRRTDRRGLARAAFTIRDPAVHVVTAVVGQLPDHRLFVRSPDRAGASRVVVAGRRLRRVVHAPIQVVAPGVQVLSLRNASATYTTTQAVGGRWSLDGHGGARTARFGLFGPFAGPAASGCDRALGPTTTREVDEDGVFDLPGRPVPSVGYYRYGIAVAANPTNRPAAVCGDPFVVRVVPRVTVALGRTRVVRGDTVAAAVDVTGLQTADPLEATVRLDGPFRSWRAATCGTKPLLPARRVAVTHDGTVVTGTWTPPGDTSPVWYAASTALSAGPYSTSAGSRCRAAASIVRVDPR